MRVLKAKSGITVLFRQVPHKVVSIRYFVRCGALDEQEKNERGLCHALEHMYFAGTVSRDWQQINYDFRSIGAYHNASTTFGYTEYEVIVPKENFQPAFEVLADMLYTPSFPEERWEEVEKPAILNEILIAYSSPEWFLENEVFAHALGPNYHGPEGSIRTIERARLSDLLSFKERFYHGRNRFLSIAGDLSEKEIRQIVGKYDRWENKKPAPRKEKDYTLNMRRRTLRRGGLNQPLISFFKPIRKIASNEEVYAQDIVFEILNTYLHTELREKLGLCYGIQASTFDELPGSDYVYVTTSTMDNETKKVMIKELSLVLVEFLEEGLSAQSIHEARMNNYREVIHNEFNPEVVTQTLAEAWLENKRTDHIEITHRGLTRVSDGAIRKLAHELLAGDFKVCTLEPK